jgi:transcriptional regulator with XRE-family HTH domain
MDGEPAAPAEPGDVGPPGVDEPWARIANQREALMPKLAGYPISGLLRRARRIAQLSQRELARRAGLSASTVTRVESGAIVPTLAAFERMLAVAGLRLVVVDDEGHVVTPMREIPDTRNGGGSRYPSHLDVILDPKPGEWWGDRYGLARPPETFHRDHDRRKAIQRRSAWEVRANRGYAPPDPSQLALPRARNQPPPPPLPPIDSNDYDVDEWDEQDVGRRHRAADGVTTDPQDS